MKKYPKSRSGYQCVGPCYPGNTIVLHPSTLQYVDVYDQGHGPDKMVCPIVPTWDEKYKITRLVDQCKDEDVANLDWENVGIESFIPQMHFNPENFLRLFYKINTMGEAIEWVQNNRNLPDATILRIIECAIFTFGQEHMNTAMDWLYTQFQNVWLPDAYQKSLHKFVKFKDDQVYIAKTSQSPDDHKDEKINYLKTQVMPMSQFSKIVQHYVEKHREKWDTITSHLTKIRGYVLQHLENRVIKKIRG